MRHGVIALILLGLLPGCATMGTSSPGSEITTTAENETTPASTLMRQAEHAYQQGDLKIAEQGFRQVIEHSPQHAPAQFALGNTLARQNRYDDAIKAYRASLANDANRMQTYNNLATIYMVQAQAILASGIEHLPSDNGDTAQIKHMLWQLKKMTSGTLQKMGSQVKE